METPKKNGRVNMRVSNHMPGCMRRVVYGLSSSVLLSSVLLPSSMLAGGVPTPSAGIRTASHLQSVSDTGDFAIATPAYGHYPSPVWCVAAITNILEVSQSTLAAQSVQRLGMPRLEDDTLPAAAAAIARSCGTSFTLANTAKPDLPDLFQLALYTGNDALAQSVLTTLVAQAETPKAKADRLVWSVQTYLATQPGRVSAAAAAAAQLDALGPDVWVQQSVAHSALVTRANAYLDRTLLQQELDKLAAATRGHLEEAASLEPLWNAHNALVRVTWLVMPDSMPAVTQRLQTAFSPPGIQRSLNTLCHLPFHYCAPPLTVTPIEQIPLEQLMTAVLATQRLVMPAPTPAPPLKADVWFAPPHGTAADTLQPAAGRLSFIYHWGTGPSSCARFNACNEDMLFVKAILAHFGKDLAVTMLVDADPVTALNVHGTPQDVAASYRWFFQTYLGLPVRVAVRMRKLAKQLPAPDGRTSYGQTTYTDPYAAHTVTIVNPQQQILVAIGGPYANGGGIGDESAATLALVLDRERRSAEARR